MTTIRILPLITASLLAFSAAATAQTSGSGMSGGTSGMSTSPGGLGSSSTGTGTTPSMSGLPGTGTTGPAASSSSGDAAARANGTCPPGTMTDYAASASNPNRCKPISSTTTGSSSIDAGQPASIMAPPSRSGAR